MVRGTDHARTYGVGDTDELPARGALGSRLKKLVQSGRVELVSSFGTANGRVVLTSGERTVEADTVVNSTGFRPDHDMVSELRLDLDPILGSTRALAPLIDPNHHSCGTVPPHGVDELTHPEPATTQSARSPTAEPRRSSWPPATNRPPNASSCCG